MPTTVQDALAQGFARLASDSVAQVLLTTSAGDSWAVVATPDRDGQRTVSMLTADFDASGIDDGQQVQMDGKTYLVNYLVQREAGYYPTTDLTTHSKLPFKTFKLVEVQ